MNCVNTPITDIVCAAKEDLMGIFPGLAILVGFIAVIAKFRSKKKPHTNYIRNFEEEPTFEKFVSGLKNGLEYFFTYKDHTIDVAFHLEGSKVVYEVNIDGYGNEDQHYEFFSIEDLVDCIILEGKSLRELWLDLET